MTKFVSLLGALAFYVLAGLFMAVAIPFGLIAMGCAAASDFCIGWAQTFYSTKKLEDEWDDEY